MFSMIGKLFGSSKAGETLVSGIASAADKLVYTSEEKADDAAKMRTEGYGVYMKWLESTSGSRLARRCIALVVVGVWAFEHMASIVMGTIAPFVDKPDAFIVASEFLSEAALENNALVGVVLLFYFGGPTAMEASKGMVQKWVNKGDKQVL